MGTNSFVADKTWQARTDQLDARVRIPSWPGAELRKLTTGVKAVPARAASSTSPGSSPGMRRRFRPRDPAEFDYSRGADAGVIAEWRNGFFVLDNWQVSRKTDGQLRVRYETAHRTILGKTLRTT